MSDTKALVRVETNPLMMPLEHWNKLKEIADNAVKSGLLPKSVDTPQKAFVIALKGHELGLPPMYSLERISVINGKTTIDGQLMLRLIYERVPGAVVDFTYSDDKRCELTMQRPGVKPQTFGFTMADANRAGLTNKQPWQQYPRAMLRWRAVAEGARIVFPDAIGGAYLPEEMEPTPPPAIEGEFTTSPVHLGMPEKPDTDSEPRQAAKHVADTQLPEDEIHARVSEASALGEYVISTGKYKDRRLGSIPFPDLTRWLDELYDFQEKNADDHRADELIAKVDRFLILTETFS